MPYLWSKACEAHETGVPMMRAMLLEFPDDPACRYLDRQYMLGSSLLVAPIFRADGVAEYYLPAGRWTNLLTGKVAEGAGWRSEKMDFMNLPLFVRENSVLAMSDDAEEPQWKSSDPLALHLFNIADGADLAVEIPAGDGESVAQFRVRRKGNAINIESDGRAKKVRAVVGSREIAWGDSKKVLSVSVEG